MLNLSSAETIALLPAAIPAMVACILPIAALDKDQATMKIVRAAIFGMALLSLFGCFFLVTKLWATGLQQSYGILRMDLLAQFAAIFVLITAALAMMQLWDHLHQEGWVKGEILALVMFSVSGMVIFCSTTHLILLFLAMEMLSLPLYALTAALRQRPQALEGGMKYFITGALASCFMLMGIVLLYGATGSFDAKGIASILGSKTLDPIGVAGAALLSLGFFFKLSAVPFHQWVPDAYEAAPHPVAAFMSVATKGVAFIAMLRIFPLALSGNPQLDAKWKLTVTFLAVATLVLGNLTALSQNNVKRMLAYSSISHAGYMLLGFTAGTQQAHAGILFYLLAYMAMNMGAFGLFTAMGLTGGNTRLEDIQGLGWKRPGIGVPVALCLFSLAGLPPLGGFFGKYMIFKELISTGHIGLTILGVTASLVSVYYYLRVVGALFGKTSNLTKDESIANISNPIPEAPLTNASILVCGILSLVMGFAQFFLVDSFSLRAIRESLQFVP